MPKSNLHRYYVMPPMLTVFFAHTGDYIVHTLRVQDPDRPDNGPFVIPKGVLKHSYSRVETIIIRGLELKFIMRNVLSKIKM